VPMFIQEANDYYRYCSGEELIKISDAICLGRRRGNFPKCKGCQFNDEDKQSRAESMMGQTPARGRDHAKTKRDAIESIFSTYDVQGMYPEPLDTEIAWRIGYATAQLLRSELRGYDRSDPAKSAVVVGRDMRKSSPVLAEALIQGLRSGGASVIDIGLVDTPQLYFAVNHLTCCGGVQVTASHNGSHVNGFKICGKMSRSISSDTGLGKICKIAKNTMPHASGQLADFSQNDLAGPYKKFVRQFLKPGGPFNEDRPLKIVVDASNGMAGRWFPQLFDDVDWLEIVRLNFDHNGEFVHDPNPLIESSLVQLKDRMSRAKAHFGLCFDGDADRCVVVDNALNTVPADLITALMARYALQEAAGSTVVYDVRSSRVVKEEIQQAGGIPRRERCGHAFIKKALSDTKGILGGELSGHYYFRDNGCCDSGVIAFVQVVNILAKSGKSLSELLIPLKRYAHSGELNFVNDDPDGTIKKLAHLYSDAKIDYLDGVTVQYEDWWFNVRQANTEPLFRLNVEAKDRDMLNAKLEKLYPHLGTPSDQ